MNEIPVLQLFGMQIELHMMGALLICFGIFALGDFLGVLTKAKVSSVFVALLLFLVLFMTKVIPANIVEIAGLSQIGAWASGYIVFHMGTMINLQQLAQEWRTVVLTLISMLVAGLAILATAPIIGLNTAIASIPIINGGMVATNTIAGAATDAGLPLIAAFAALLYAVQKFIGTPFASYFGLREASEILAEYRKDKTKFTKKQVDVKQDEKVPFFVKYDKYFTDFMTLGISAFFVFLSNVIAYNIKVSTGLPFFHFTIFCLIFGATVGYFKLVPPKILERGKSSGLLSVAVFVTIIPSLAKIKLSDFGTMSVNLIIIFAAVILALTLLFYFTPLWKLHGSRNLSVGIAMGQLLGFPATYLISQEIAKAVTDDKEEQDAILEVIAPSYIIAGFASVTTFSIVVAGILAGFIQ